MKVNSGLYKGNLILSDGWKEWKMYGDACVNLVALGKTATTKFARYKVFVSTGMTIWERSATFFE